MAFPGGSLGTRSRDQIQCTDRIGGITKFTFDANSNLLSLEDADAVASASGKKTLYVYDARDRKTSEAFPGHDPAAAINTANYDQVNFRYDAMDRVTARTDQMNQTIGYAFDLAGRMLTRSYPNNQNDTFTFDTASRMLTASSARYANTVTKTYNTDGTLATETLTTGGKTYPVTYGYDAANLNTSITYPSGKLVNRSYNARNQLAEIFYEFGDCIPDRTYDNGGRLIATSYQNDRQATRTYRTDNLVSTISIPGVTNFSYTWDANKNKTGETDSAVVPYSWTTGTTGYDAEDRLIGWNRSNGNSGAWNLSLVGDWNSVATNGITESRTHNAVHEMLTRDAEVLGYDSRGNLELIGTAGAYYSSGPGITTPPIAGAFWRYTWSEDNLLENAEEEESAHQTEFTYDALGRRVSKTHYTGSGTVTTIYVSSLNQEIAEYAPSAAVTSPTYEYVFGDYIDEVLMRVTSATGARHYYHQDAQYSVRAITDDSGDVVERYAYDPYGAVIYLTTSGTLSSNQASAIGNTILYTGRRLDTETGLFYYRARYYDSKLGRFCSRDPIGYGDGFNHYSGKMDINRIDPRGTSGAKPRSNSECCSAGWDDPEIAIAEGKDEPSRGMVICCDGRKVLCARIRDVKPGDVPWARIVGKCVVEHEDTHVDDIGDCEPFDPCKPKIDRLPFLPEKNPNFEECKAYEVQFECIFRRSVECNGNRDCLDYLKNEARNLKNKMRRRSCGSNYGIWYPEDWDERF